MTQKSFLTFAALIACTIGALALLAPETLLVVMKQADPGGSALVMARTAGAFLLPVGLLNALVRSDADSPTMAKVLLINALLQLLILPIDPIAYMTGIYGSVVSFLPNTILHIALLFGFLTFWSRMTARLRAHDAQT